ncbi:HipA domain-containing protein [Microbacterium sp. ET2]|uniref:HipA domain-containing protein n=1 Tax=Microbacterium albipurpureum TaxID=3050384 RepID=UPI00259CC399|nr:HipA domain-containing protein [Microbacterium sp. ET2 (Ac-2212)]WJL97039.1 HipA domain-containing protein [Microbacterium sp. ET2 (Ac-2212)]
MNPVVRQSVDDWEVLRVEQRGAAAKNWLLEDGGSRTDPQSEWLFKPVHTHANGTRQVGDWTEVIASLVAARLRLPSAEARLASRDGEEGVLVRNVRPLGYEMHSGTLALLDRGIELRREVHDGPATIGHSIDNIIVALDGLRPPPSATSWGGCTASDLFAAFLLLDTLIANGDRHEENWSILRGESPMDDSLAPSYDMENSLGFQLRDIDRKRHLFDGCRTYARNGLAKRLDGDRRNTLVSVAARMYRLTSDAGRRRLDQLVDDVAAENFENVVPQSDAVSEATRMFAVALLTVNARRIADAIDCSR